MLRILLLGLIGGLISASPALLSFLFEKENEQRPRKIMLPLFFILGFIWTLLFAFYTACHEQTIFTVLLWSIVMPIVYAFIIFIILEEYYTAEFRILIILSIIYGIAFSSTLFCPVQNLIYVHDTQDIDIAYSISSDEILARIDVNILNGGTSSIANTYSVDVPEMRKIDGKDVAVYPIRNSDNASKNVSEYIPGYIILESEKTHRFITKRIYFDTSYVFKKDALRLIRRKYPTLYIGDHKFDIDDEYNPYEIFVYRENRFYSNGNDYGLIILNLQDGTSEKYPADEIPSWVDFKSTYPI